MFAPKFEPTKLKTNLRICVTRLKNLHKTKNELNIRARRELAEYLKAKKVDRARIRVEQIVREDYLLEVLDIIELYCDLLVTRFGLITSTVECDPGLKEAIATIIWVAPRLSYDCEELKVLQTQLALKYGREFALACSSNSNHEVNPKVMQKLNVKAPPCNLCEAYLVEIARSYDVEFTPDQCLLNNGQLIDLGAPPAIPDFDSITKSILDSDDPLKGLGAPYPMNPDMGINTVPAVPSLGESEFGPLNPPPYQHVAKHDDDGSCDSAGINPIPPPFNPSVKYPPGKSDDDDDLDSLTARFNDLRKDK